MPRLFPAADPAHRYPRVTSSRVLAALFDLAVGLRLLFADDILGATPGYRLMHAHFIGDVWLGLALLAFGAVMAAGLYTDRWSVAAGGATWLALLTWLLVAIDITLVNGSQIGTFAYGILAVGVHLFAYAHLREWQEQLHRGAGR